MEDAFAEFADKMSGLKDGDQQGKLFSRTDGDLEIKEGMSVDDLADMYETICERSKMLTKAKSYIKAYLMALADANGIPGAPGTVHVTGNRKDVAVTKQAKLAFDDNAALTDMANGAKLPIQPKQSFGLTDAKIRSLNETLNADDLVKIAKYVSVKGENVTISIENK